MIQPLNQFFKVMKKDSCNRVTVQLNGVEESNIKKLTV